MPANSRFLIMNRRHLPGASTGGRVISATLIALAAAFALLLVFAMRSQALLGTPGIYTEASGDTVEICADAACSVHTTDFNPGDTVYLRITTDRVRDDSRRSRLQLYDYRRNRLQRVSWTQTSYGAPYVYEGSLTLPPSIPDYVQVTGELRDGPGNEFVFEKQLDIAGLNQYTKFFSDPALSDEAYTFAPGAEMYITAYGNGNRYSARRTGRRQDLTDFSDNRVQRWDAPAVIQNGNWYDFSLTMPTSGLTDGDWYWLELQLRDNRRRDILRMSQMVQVDGSAPVATITAPSAGGWVSGNLPVEGTADDAYSFHEYVLEYGEGAAPSSWIKIGSTGTSPVVAGVLGAWDTTTVTDGPYTLRLTVMDRARNTNMDTVQVSVDNNSPTISSVQSSAVTSQSSLVSWDTDEAADSQVEYGTSPGVYTWSTTLDPALVTSHAQPLSGLQQSTVYYYRVRSADQAGNVAYSPEESFETANLTVIQPFPGLGMDTYFGSFEDTWNHGAEANLRVGDEASAGLGTLRSTLQFDLSGIPAGATISSAMLSLYQAGQASSGTPTLDIHYLTQSWTQGSGSGSDTGDGATWLTYDGSTGWAAAGGDFNAGPSASAAASGATGVWVDWDLASLTQDWIDGTVENNGLLVKQDFENPSGDDAKFFLSSDYGIDHSLRPKLIIEWIGEDVTPPQIGEARTENVSTTSADIAWSTDEGATTQVDYGTTTSYGSTTPLDPSMANQHLAPLTGLTGGTVYHYRVRSMDAAGNETVSEDHSFQTATMIVIQPDGAGGMDTMFQSNMPDLNSGAAQWLLAGDFNSFFWGTTRSVIRFDLSAVPEGSIINSATFSLYQIAQLNNSTPTLDVHYLTQDWLEGTGVLGNTGDGATWSTYDGSTAWSSPGGDYSPAPSASAVAPDSNASWVDWDLSGLTQAWVDGSTPNNGLLLKQDVENPWGTDMKLYASSDYAAAPALRPKLVIEYVPAPGAISMTIDETWNRDNTPGLSSVSFGNVSAGSNYIIGDSAAPPYAVKLTIESSGLWGLKVAASDDLQSLPAGNSIDISSLNWKRDSETAVSYQPMVKVPAETVIDSGQPMTYGAEYLFDYRLAVPAAAVSGAYSTSVIYTAYPE